MSKEKPQSHPATKPAAAVTPPPKEVVKPHEAVETGSEVESAKAKPFGTSPAESARKQSASDTYEGPGTGGSLPDLAKDEALKAANDKVKADEKKDADKDERRDEMTKHEAAQEAESLSDSSRPTQFGIRHGELGSRETSAVAEGFTEQNAKELRAIEDYNRGDAGPLKALGFIEIMQVVKWLTTEVGKDLPAFSAEYNDCKNSGPLRERSQVTHRLTGESTMPCSLRRL